ncbi:hypothetical protein TWF694_007650 [Orbilia ellipsospora]|uniref:Uncharacterized protein n=1 Tax=Orbilia ellipsospora TaxID=2528407 RepID=A0AAV9XJU1_9PEZI
MLRRSRRDAAGPEIPRARSSSPIKRTIRDRLTARIKSFFSPEQTYPDAHALYALNLEEPLEVTSAARIEVDQLKWPDDMATSLDGIDEILMDNTDLAIHDTQQMTFPQGNRIGLVFGPQTTPQIQNRMITQTQDIDEEEGAEEVVIYEGKGDSEQAEVDEGVERSLMQAAGASRKSDNISPPFNLWDELITAIASLGVDENVVNAALLARYSVQSTRTALWHEESAIAMFKDELRAYRTAIAYIRESSKHIKYPENTEIKKAAWMQLGGFEFRLAAVSNYLDILCKDLTKCKTNCPDTEAGRVMAMNALELKGILKDIDAKVDELREVIIYRLVRKHDTARNKITVFSSFGGFF